MKIIELETNPGKYSCKCYLILGSWNAITDVNTVVDVGTDAYFLNDMEKINTGVGKKAIQQVVLTHCHFDHSGGLKKVKDRYQPKVLAYNKIEGVDEMLVGGETLKMGDGFFDVIHFPGHSQDSLCFYCQAERTLFAGDTQLVIRSPGGSFLESYLHAFLKLVALPIEKIYFGHDKPLFGEEKEIRKILIDTLSIIRKSQIVKKTDERDILP
ncbi:MAG: MBL fold metallo-hydrolase [Candidatus Riflebacteria bacterium]|nr:MBL fold metallo-hydrolase [Candidatus Riflebacteria bacterium]